MAGGEADCFFGVSPKAAVAAADNGEGNFTHRNPIPVCVLLLPFVENSKVKFSRRKNRAINNYRLARQIVEVWVEVKIISPWLQFPYRNIIALAVSLDRIIDAGIFKRYSGIGGIKSVK